MGRNTQDLLPRTKCEGVTSVERPPQPGRGLQTAFASSVPHPPAISAVGIGVPAALFYISLFAADLSDREILQDTSGSGLILPVAVATFDAYLD